MKNKNISGLQSQSSLISTSTSSYTLSGSSPSKENYFFKQSDLNDLTRLEAIIKI